VTASTVCLVTDGPAETYFANRVHQEVGIDLLLVVETAGVIRRGRALVQSIGPPAIADVLSDRLVKFRGARHRTRELDRWFGDAWQHLAGDIPVRRTRTTMDPALVDEVLALPNSRLAVHASTLVPMSLVGACTSALNLHWGLSPYYRGTHCTDWALLHWDTRNIGVTLHELTETIDGGRIVAQRRATLSAGDTAHSIDAQLTVLGTDLMIEALQILREEGSLVTHPQDLGQGHITYKRQWSRHLRRQVARLERDGLTGPIERPTREELPIASGPRRADRAAPATSPASPTI
jgi:hypothetical protein